MGFNSGFKGLSQVERRGRDVFWRAVLSVSGRAQENLWILRHTTVKHDQMLFELKSDSMSQNSNQNTEKFGTYPIEKALVY